MAECGPYSTDLELYDQDWIGRVVDEFSETSLLRRHALDYAGRVAATQAFKEATEMLGVDSLTGAMSRDAFDYEFEQLIEKKTREDMAIPERRHGDQARKHGIALLYLDLDGFKAINDTLGHDAGDVVLMQFVAGLRQVLRDEDLIGRRGGDEFVVLLNQGIDRHGTEHVCERIIEMANQIDVQGTHALVGVSIGGIMHQLGYTTDAMMEAADARMLYAKDLGKNRAMLDYVDVPVK